jgi:hypothetical protein
MRNYPFLAVKFYRILQTKVYCLYRFELIQRTLGAEQVHEVFWLKPPNTCFKHGVFGTTWDPTVGSLRDVIDDVTTALLGTQKNRAANYVTAVQRKERRFVNADAMLAAIKDVVGESRTRLVELDDLDVTKQVLTIVTFD